jgi:copper(I)-binding protein
MRINLPLSVSLLVAVTLQTPSAGAQQPTAGDVVISQPWSRATPGGAKVASGYMTIENKGATADRLLGASSDAAAKIQVHEMATNNGVMTMRPLENGLTIEPNATTRLTPGSYHLMLTDITHPFKQGDKVSVTLDFEKAGKMQVTLNVLGVGAKGPNVSSAAPAGKMDQGKMEMDHSKMKM